MDKKYTVLIADDDPSLRKGMEVKFKSKGYDVITASDGEEAINNALEQKPDLIIMDQLMPKFTGLAAIKHIRADFDWGRHVPIIVMTNVAEGTSAHRELILVSTRYFVKSNTSLDTLIKTANELLGFESDSSSEAQESESNQDSKNDSAHAPTDADDTPNNEEQKTNKDHNNVDNDTSTSAETSSFDTPKIGKDDENEEAPSNNSVVINTTNDSSTFSKDEVNQSNLKDDESSDSNVLNTTDNASANDNEAITQADTGNVQINNENSEDKFDNQAL